MSTYRCPICGAGHKHEAERCRLCGQSMDPTNVARSSAVATRHRAPRGVKMLAFIAVGAVIAIAAGTLALGFADEAPVIRQAKGLVSSSGDGWSSLSEAEGRFTVQMPDKRTRGTRPFTAVDSGQITDWHATIGDDTELFVGWGKVATPASMLPERYLEDVILQRWMEGSALTYSFVNHTAVSGLPALTARTSKPMLKLGDRDAYAHVVFALNGTTLYVIHATTVYADSPQLARLANSFSVTG